MKPTKIFPIVLLVLVGVIVAAFGVDVLLQLVPVVLTIICVLVLAIYAAAAVFGLFAGALCDIGESDNTSR